MTDILIPALIFALLGAAIGIMLAVASKAFAVPVNEKAEAITEVLPGANCGGCGYSGCAALADDSGICAHALDGAPGVYSARFSGGTDDDNNALLLEKLRDKDDKGAHYTCAMALVYPDGRAVFSEGYMYGTITDSPRGSRGFGYDPLFIPTGETRTVAEMTDDEKNAISHRAKALAELLSKI